ncbi:MAG: M16 family metallopeptidase [Armatimonadota bacterium]
MRRHRGTAGPLASPWRLAAAMILAGALAGSAAYAQSAPHKSSLPNGMRVIVQENDHTSTVVIAAMVRVTALHEPRQATGIRQLTQSMLASGECCQDEMRRAAVRAEGGVAPDYVELSLAAPADALEDAVRLMRRMLFRPVLSEEALELVRPTLVRTLVARAELPATFALDRLYQTMYPRVRSGDIAAGDPLEVASITLDEIRRFHADHYLPNATVLVISGGIDGSRAMEIASREMVGLLPGALPTEAAQGAPTSGPGVEEIEIAGRTGVVAVGGRAVALDSPDYPAMATGMVLLGSGMDSRLYRSLRVDRSLAYTIVAELTPSAIAPSGLVLVTCDPDDLDEVQRVIAEEIERATTTPASATELQRARRYLIGKHALRRQRNQEIAHYLAMFELLGGVQGHRSDAQLAGQIASVDADAVAGALRQLFRPAWTVRLRASGAGAD